MVSDRIFCAIRRKWVKRTPEEGVRQALVHYLISELGYPLSLMAAEYSLTINARAVRCDIVVFDNLKHEPLLVVECKAPGIQLDDKVADQIARYNLGLRVPHLLLSNGQQHLFYSLDVDGSGMRAQAQIAGYKDIMGSVSGYQ
jgi:hypothetical protein